MDLKVDLEAFKKKNLNHLVDRADPATLLDDDSLGLLRHNLALNLRLDGEQTITELGGTPCDFEPSGLPWQMLRYFNLVASIFDLEFFSSKITSSAFAVASVENSVVSGLRFWEPSDQELLEEMAASDPDDEVTETVMPSQNKHALAVAEKIAREKSEKMQLTQELETVTDKFRTLERIMSKQEMQASLSRACAFLRSALEIRFHGLVVGLGEVLDSFLKEGRCQKEVIILSEALASLTNLSEVRFTLPNGFHVVPKLRSVNLETSTYQPDQDLFWECARPVIDEEALNPHQYTLIKSIYGRKKYCFRENQVRFAGNTGGLRQFSCLDLLLTNVERAGRRYISNHIQAADKSIQSYVHAQLGMNPEDFEAHPSVYCTILDEMLRGLKLQRKARQLRGVVIIILTGAPTPIALDQYAHAAQLYHEATQWKIQNQLDNIQAGRQHRAARAAAITSQQPSNQAELRASLKIIDQARAEAEVAQSEVARFLMQASIDLFHRETVALTKAFEMSSLEM